MGARWLGVLLAIGMTVVAGLGGSDAATRDRIYEERWALGHSWVVLRDTSGNEFCVLD